MLLCVVVVAGCGGTQTPTTGAGDGSGSGSGPTLPIAKTLLGFSATGYNPASVHPQNQLYLDVTNHNGATLSYPVGAVAAPCTAATGNGSDIVVTMRCDVAGTGAELRAVYRGTTEIIVLRRNYTPEDDPADLELSFREVMRVPVPPGSKVKPAS